MQALLFYCSVEGLESEANKIYKANEMKKTNEIDPTNEIDNEKTNSTLDKSLED